MACLLAASDAYSSNAGRANRGISHYLADRSDADIMVDFFVGSKKLRSSYAEAEEALPPGDETRDLPDLEVPNWNVVHNPETAKIIMNDELFKEQMNDSQVDAEWLQKRKVNK